MIVNWITSNEKLNGWEPLDSVLASEVLVNSGVQLGNFDQRTLNIVFLTKVRKGRSHLLAVSTPRGIEFNKDNIVLADEIGGIGVFQYVNRLLSFDIIKLSNSD